MTDFDIYTFKVMRELTLLICKVIIVVTEKYKKASQF